MEAAGATTVEATPMEAAEAATERRRSIDTDREANSHRRAGQQQAA